MTAGDHSLWTVTQAQFEAACQAAANEDPESSGTLEIGRKFGIQNVKFLAQEPLTIPHQYSELKILGYGKYNTKIVVDFEPNSNAFSGQGLLTIEAQGVHVSEIGFDGKHYTDSTKRVPNLVNCGLQGVSPPEGLSFINCLFKNSGNRGIVGGPISVTKDSSLGSNGSNAGTMLLRDITVENCHFKDFTDKTAEGKHAIGIAIYFGNRASWENSGGVWDTDEVPSSTITKNLISNIVRGVIGDCGNDEWFGDYSEATDEEDVQNVIENQPSKQWGSVAETSFSYTLIEDNTFLSMKRWGIGFANAKKVTINKNVISLDITAHTFSHCIHLEAGASAFNITENTLTNDKTGVRTDGTLQPLNACIAILDGTNGDFQNDDGLFNIIIDNNTFDGKCANAIYSEVGITDTHTLQHASDDLMDAWPNLGSNLLMTYINRLRQYKIQIVNNDFSQFNVNWVNNHSGDTASTGWHYRLESNPLGTFDITTNNNYGTYANSTFVVNQ
ncbi:MAG: hypothetical protein AAFX93_11190 [Verrucomicrobiota bacterium]